MALTLYNAKGVRITCETERGILLTFTSENFNVKKIYKLCVSGNGISCKKISESILYED